MANWLIECNQSILSEMCHVFRSEVHLQTEDCWQRILCTCCFSAVRSWKIRGPHAPQKHNCNFQFHCFSCVGFNQIYFALCFISFFFLCWVCFHFSLSSKFLFLFFFVSFELRRSHKLLLSLIFTHLIFFFSLFFFVIHQFPMRYATKLEEMRKTAQLAA